MTDRLQPPRRIVGVHALAKLTIDLLGQTGTLIQQKARQITHRRGQHATLPFDDGRKVPDIRKADGRHDPLFSQMCPQRVNRLRALAFQDR